MVKAIVIRALAVLIGLSGAHFIGLAWKGSGPTVLAPIEYYRPTQAHLDRLTEQLEVVRHSHPEVSGESQIIRWINPEDFEQVHATCLQEHGVAAPGEVNPATLTAEQARDADQASFECTGAYPVRGDMGDQLSATEKWYEYTLIDAQFAPCMQDRGYAVDLPSRMSFVFGAPWDPMLALRESNPDTETQSLNTDLGECWNQMPPLRKHA